jgi:hypothetical protein
MFKASLARAGWGLGLWLLVCSPVSAGMVYIGNAASLGKTFSSTNRADSIANLTYIFSTDSYQLATTTKILLSEVNFFTGSGGAGQTVTPFVALYNGGATNLGTSYTLLLKGDPITAVSGLNNASFTVGGVNPLLQLNAGDRLVAESFRQATSSTSRAVPLGTSIFIPAT